jgi:hypothetical protein
MQAGLEPGSAVERNGTEFSQCNLAGEAFHELGVQYGESIFLIDALFLVYGERRRKEKKKYCHGGGGFSRTGCSILASQWVAALRCN